MRIFIIGFFFFSNVNAQQRELQIKYDVVDKSRQFNSRMELQHIGGKTLISIINRVPRIDECTGSRVTVENGHNNFEQAIQYKDHYEYVYKDYGSSEIISEERYHTYVKEEMSLFDWNLISSTDSILGYKCQKATTHFRGRDYSAWFCTDLPFRCGPWKFNGLPGVILKIESDDQYFVITANQLKISFTPSDFKNPYKNNKTISWDEFRENYTKMYDGAEEKIKSQMARLNKEFHPRIMMDPRVEIIIEKYNRESHNNVWSENSKIK